MQFDFGKKLLFAGEEDTGKYNHISMTRGAVDWHSHPAKCLNDDTCALGLPSPTDLENIVLGALFGTVAHMVYSKEGTYVVSLKQDLLARLQKATMADLELFMREIEHVFNDLHADFIKNTKMAYKQHCRRWIRAARQRGFVLRLFRKDAIPSIHFGCACDVRESSRIVTPQINIPTKYEKILTH